MPVINLVLLSLLLLTSPAVTQAEEIGLFLGSRSVVGQVYFSKGSSQLSAKSQQSLRALAEAMQDKVQNGRLLRVEGFASPDGHRSSNFDLSMQRAVAVRNYLQRQGLSAELFLTGHGDKKQSTAKLSEQRRVDIAVYQETQAVRQLLRESGRIERFVIQ